MVIAMEAALQGHPGVVVISGTGSIAYGRDARGETARAGGWGFAISDEGSGQWIGRTAVAEVMHAFDSGRATGLLERILSTWKLDSRDALIPYVNSTPPPNFAELFPTVLQAAKDHDSVAEEVLTGAGGELANLALTVMRRLWKREDTVRIGVTGGVFAHSAHVRRAFYDAMVGKWAKTSVCFKITEPVVGALWMARRTVVSVGAR
jgi:N-acetylglucosamine kinase-like BadF-type ATPase